jgi:hypothetical protein
MGSGIRAFWSKDKRNKEQGFLEQGTKIKGTKNKAQRKSP